MMVDLADLRKQADERLMHGGCSVMRAFNLTNESSWTFAPETRARAEQLLRELVCLFHESEIRPQPIALAKGDGDFRRFMQAAMAKPQRKRLR